MEIFPLFLILLSLSFQIDNCFEKSRVGPKCTVSWVTPKKKKILGLTDQGIKQGR